MGDKELREKLRELTNAEARKVVQGATREAAKIIAAQVKSNAPALSGSLRRSIKVRAIRRSRKRIGMRVTTWSGDNLYQGKQFYAAFQEFGFKTGRRRPKPSKEPNAKPPKARRQIEGSHFMLAAAKSKQSAAIAAFKAVIGTHIARVMAKRKK